MKDKGHHHHHHHHHHIDKNTISEQDAIDRTLAWRTFIRKNIPGENNSEIIPRAVYISMDDIKALYDKHKDHAVAVRAYFTYCEQTLETDTSVMIPEVSVLLVPVNHKDEDMLSPDLSLGAGKSSVYDFTKPCPDMCDKQSPLYSNF